MELPRQNRILLYLLVLSLATATHTQSFYLVGQFKRPQQEVELVKERTTSPYCSHFSTGKSEECKYYGSCCNDPMRLREMLQKGTFHCETIIWTDRATCKYPQ